MTTAKILEVFRSVQGEGPYAGVTQVFVRFFECNMHCTWCDTPASIGDTSRNYKEVSLADLLGQVTRLARGCHSFSITGGEPLLQASFLKQFLPALKQLGPKIYLETNGICPQELKTVIDLVDIVSMDLKLPSSTKQQAYWNEHQEFLKVAKAKEVFVKVVVTVNTTLEDFKKAVDLVASVDRNIIFVIQPNTYDLKDGSMNLAIEWQNIAAEQLRDVRVLPQVHKFLKIR